MKNCMITFRSVTPAQRGEGVLKRSGIPCTLGRTPKWMEQQGCGYSLRLNCRDTAAAVHALQQNNIAYRKVYTQLGESLEELHL